MEEREERKRENGIEKGASTGNHLVNGLSALDT